MSREAGVVLRYQMNLVLFSERLKRAVVERGRRGRGR
jgi:hypothetical protein